MNKILVFFFLILLSCSNSDKKKLQFLDKGRDVPVFEADSAYSFIEKQLENGPRVPNTYGHVETRKYIVNKLQEYAGKNSVFVQYFEADGYSETLKLANIIAAFNPTAPDRIMLNAHWDTRPRADEDTERSVEPIAGADDGASGVAVLLELARIFSEENPPIGVDIVLFDGEDYGTSGDLSRYFLGSRHWSKNPPVPGYNPRFGILLDMVGAENAVFPKEVNSIAYAPNLMDEIWAIAGQKGYGDIFLNEVGAAVIDDHYIITNETKIPVIDIIHHTKGIDGNIRFAPHWHTHKDDLPIIDKKTLEAVGSVLLELIYNRI